MLHPNAPAPRAAGLTRNLAHSWGACNAVLSCLDACPSFGLRSVPISSDPALPGRIARNVEVLSCRF